MNRNSYYKEGGFWLSHYFADNSIYTSNIINFNNLDLLLCLVEWFPALI